MKLHVLGTSAAEGIPAIGCGCSTCRTARERGGRNIRSRTGAVIDDVLKIDFGPDTLYHIHRDRLDSTRWKWILFTHAHDDHCLESEIGYLLPGFAPRSTAEQLELYGNDTVLERIAGIGHATPDLPLDARPITAFEPLCLGDYTVTPVRARHTEKQECFNFVIEREYRRALYACDTGWYPDESWRALQGMALDVVVMECTHGFETPGHAGHLDLNLLVRMRDEMARIGALSADCRFAASHFSHNGGALQAELEARLNPLDIAVAYDGLVLEV